MRRAADHSLDPLLRQPAVRRPRRRARRKLRRQSVALELEEARPPRVDPRRDHRIVELPHAPGREVPHLPPPALRELCGDRRPQGGHRSSDVGVTAWRRAGEHAHGGGVQLGESKPMRSPHTETKRALAGWIKQEDLRQTRLRTELCV